MASQQLNIRISDAEHQHLENLASQTDGILTKQAVARLLIKHAIATGWSPLDRGGEMANNLEQPGQAQAACCVPELLHPPVSLSTRQEKQSKTTAFETATLPAELEAMRQTFVRFGKVKKGDRGEHGAKLAATGLKKIGEKYGWAVATEQLDLAINNRWAGISLSNYEKFLPKAAVKEPEHRHPASRVFTADKGFDDGPTTNPILKELL